VILKSDELNIDRIEQTMDNLSDLFAKQTEIDESIKYSDSENVDFEKELEALIENEKILMIESQFEHLNVADKLLPVIVSDYDSTDKKEIGKDKCMKEMIAE
jgi:hypothetical protein